MPNAQKKTVKSRAKTAGRKPKRKIKRAAPPDNELAAIVGSKPLPRSELTKKLWEYIKKHGVQDKKRRTMKKADDSLKAVFDGKMRKRDIYRTRSGGAGAARG